MSKQRKRGFNAPFGQLKKLTPKAPAAKPAVAVPQAEPPPGPSDALLFEQAMHGIAPLSSDRTRIAKLKQAVPRTDTGDALALAELQDLVAGRGVFRTSESEEMHTGVAPGVSFQLLEQLQRGQFAYHLHLDLHGYRRDEAHREVARFVANARRRGERCILIVTGRGKSSPMGHAVLREALSRWLTRAPSRAHVLAFCTARSVDGGPGAFYVLLRRPGVKPFGTKELP